MFSDPNKVYVMKINMNDLRLNVGGKTIYKSEEIVKSNTNNNNRYDVETKVEKDLISKMLFIEKALSKEEERNENKINEIKNKIKKNEYSVQARDIIETIERGGI